MKPTFLSRLRCAFVGLLAALPGRATAAEPADRIARVEAGLMPRIVAEGRPLKWTLQERMARYRVPGVSIAVINDGKLEWARGYGTLEAGGADPVTADTLFQAASISKPVAALAVLRLVEAGKLQLDQDINLALKSWQVPANDFTAREKVTVRRILSHTAGLTVHGFRGYAAGEPVPSLGQMLDGERPSNSPAIRVDVLPGSIERYSGGGYLLLTQLVRDITGESFDVVLSASVFKPLGMTRSTFEQPLSAAWSANAARAHSGNGVMIPGQWHTYPELAPDALWTTPSDLALFAIELQQSLRGESNKVISAAMTKTMMTRQLRSMGLGIVVDREGDALRFQHGGSNAGFQCLLAAYASGRGVVIMTNADGGSRLISEIQRAIAAEYDWPDSRPVQRKPVPVEDKVLAGHAGQYRSTPEGGPTVNVRVEQGALAVDVGGQRMNLLAETAARFRVIEDETTATFFTVGGQKALWAANRLWQTTEAATPAPAGGIPAPKAGTAATAPTGAFLVLRNGRSFGRPFDFEQVLRAFGREVDVRGAGGLGELDLARYATIVVAGGQPREFYEGYVRHAARLDEFVAKGGTLILELNGAEGHAIVLPRGVTMTASGGLENAILAADHPILSPFHGERLIRANYASHGYLAGVPAGAQILAVESRNGEGRADRPTWVEYPHGRGRVMAACQCFHDQDSSGRGPLMATLMDYAATTSPDATPPAVAPP
jgi:CubicO group peptidase (beta-lactamase class C family)